MARGGRLTSDDKSCLAKPLLAFCCFEFDIESLYIFHGAISESSNCEVRFLLGIRDQKSIFIQKNLMFDGLGEQPPK